MSVCFFFASITQCAWLNKLFCFSFDLKTHLNGGCAPPSPSRSIVKIDLSAMNNDRQINRTMSKRNEFQFDQWFHWSFCNGLLHHTSHASLINACISTFSFLINALVCSVRSFPIEIFLFCPDSSLCVLPYRNDEWTYKFVVSPWLDAPMIRLHSTLAPFKERRHVLRLEFTTIVYRTISLSKASNEDKGTRRTLRDVRYGHIISESSFYLFTETRTFKLNKINKIRRERRAFRTSHPDEVVVVRPCSEQRRWSIVSIHGLQPPLGHAARHSIRSTWPFVHLPPVAFGVVVDSETKFESDLNWYGVDERWRHVGYLNPEMWNARGRWIDRSYHWDTAFVWTIHWECTDHGSNIVVGWFFGGVGSRDTGGLGVWNIDKMTLRSIDVSWIDLPVVVVVEEEQECRQAENNWTKVTWLDGTDKQRVWMGNSSNSRVSMVMNSSNRMMNESSGRWCRRGQIDCRNPWWVMFVRWNISC